MRNRCRERGHLRHAGLIDAFGRVPLRDQVVFTHDVAAFSLWRSSLSDEGHLDQPRAGHSPAVHDRVGVFEVAHGGTLFLSEIGDVSPTLQVRLLRLLQAREVRRGGEVRLWPVAVRLIAATHRDLAEEVSQGRFRQGLY